MIGLPAPLRHATGLAICFAVWAALSAPHPACATPRLELTAVPPSHAAVLERVVLIARHGIRSPTHDPETLQRETGAAWPVWPVGPGQLTTHGRRTLDALMRDIARYYDLACTRKDHPCLTRLPPVVWADSADDRTRDSGQIMARAFDPSGNLRAHSLAPGARDPLFNALTEAFIQSHRDEIRMETSSVVEADRQARPRAVTDGLVALQALIAPGGCIPGNKPCFTGPLDLSAGRHGVAISGGAASAASVAENLLLIHVEGLDHAGLGWVDKIDPALLTRVMPVHEYLSRLTRRHGVLISQKISVMGGAIEAFLAGDDVTLSDGTGVGQGTALLAFAGHDTTLEALAGYFGLDWHFDDQPDRTAPDTTLAFERWREASGKITCRVRIFHQSLAALRAGIADGRPPRDVGLLPR